MASIPLGRASWRAPEGPPRNAAARGADIPLRLQQQQQQRLQMRAAASPNQDSQHQQPLPRPQQGRTHQQAVQPRVRTVAWQPNDYSARDEEAALFAPEARIEVTAQCRPKEEVFRAFKEAIRIHPKLSAKHRELLGNTVKGLIADRRVSYYLISAMRAMMSAAACAWQTANEKGVPPSLSKAAAAVAAELTIAGVSPKEAGERAAETAVSKGIGAVKNLVLQHKAEHQRQQHAAAAAAALRRAQEAAAAADDSSDGLDEGSDDSNPLPDVKGPPPAAPDSAAAASHGVHIPQQLIETATSDAVLPYAAYFDKRLEMFLFLLIDEMRNLARNTWKLVEDKLLPAADSKEAKVFYLQLSADATRYTSQVVLDLSEVEKLRRQSLNIYRTALELFEKPPEEGEEETPLSAKMGLLLNYAVLLHDEPDGVQKAIDALAAQFREAVDNVVHITDAEESRRVVMVMSLLRGNVESWCKELGRTDATALLGLDGSAARVV